MANKPNSPQNPARTLKFALSVYAQGIRSVCCVKKVTRSKRVLDVNPSQAFKTRTCHTESQIHNFFTGTTPEGKTRLEQREKAEVSRWNALYEKLAPPKGRKERDDKYNSNNK
jgi:hypothetical protein